MMADCSAHHDDRHDGYATKRSSSTKRPDSVIVVATSPASSSRMAVQFDLSGPELDFVYLNYIGSILPFIRTL
jgi:hypothetical protein